jgi:thiamine-phosphate pyrophosphorylase
VTHPDADRRIVRLYGIADADAARARYGGDPVALGEVWLRAGCRLLQLRCKGWPDDEVLRAARALAPRCRAVGATLIVNDSAEIAAAAGADGVHLGQLDGAVADARRVLGAGAIVGRSTGDPDAARLAASDADYVAFGPIRATPNLSRPKPAVGLDGLRAARAQVPVGVPLVAIGGITPELLPSLIDAGATAWAVIGAVAAAPDPDAAVAALL